MADTQPPVRRMTGSRYLAEAMQAYGVSHFFLVPTILTPALAEMHGLGITCVTDRCLADALEPADIGRIIATAQAAAPRLTRLVERVIAEC